MLDRRLHTDTARELWNDLSFVDSRVKQQTQYILSLSSVGRINFLELLSDADDILIRFKRRRMLLRKIRDNDWMRTSGQIECRECGKHHNRHPNVEGYEWLTILCDGSLVKL